MTLRNFLGLDSSTDTTPSFTERAEVAFEILHRQRLLLRCRLAIVGIREHALVHQVELFVELPAALFLADRKTALLGPLFLLGPDDLRKPFNAAVEAICVAPPLNAADLLRLDQPAPRVPRRTF